MPQQNKIKSFLNSIIGIKESEVIPVTEDLFGDTPQAGTVDVEKPFSTQSSMYPTEEIPVGTSRVKETGITEGKTGKTFLGLAETGGKDIQKEAKKIKGPGEIITPTEATESLETKIQASRPRIEANLPAGTTFPEIKSGESFESYYKKVKKMFPDPGSMQALKDEAAKQYAIRYEEYKNLAKNPDLLEAISSESNYNVDDYIGEEYEKGMKVKSSTTSGVRGLTTEALEKVGYITKADSKAIDSAIEKLIDENPQDIERQFTKNEKTGKAYTKNEMKRLIKTRFLFALSKYFNEEIKPAMIDEVMEKMRGSYAAVNAEAVAQNIYTNKVRPKFVKPFLASFLGIIKSGGASTLLNTGTGAMLGVPMELLFPNKAEAAEMFSEEEMGKLNIAQAFGGEEGYQKQQEEILKNRGVVGL